MRVTSEGDAVMHPFLRFLQRLARDQKVRFLAVGAVNTGLGFALFVTFDLLVFRSVPFGYLISLAVSYSIAITVAFVLYRRFVFQVSGRIVSDFLKFIGVYVVAIGVNAAALPVLVEIVDLSPLLAQGIVLVCTTAISYFGHRGFSFRRPSKG